ncbi:odv-e56 [Hyphantria cunea granulovirus]|uniref:Odv-e56 n=1 Tax=Hyphantria cunea granulovirus TaxID=307448 RepID=A0AAF1D250_9BBAC|nr:odv-e56 [Hyphantria cunea granulovirus]QBQ01565.1 odv-e56 [Hyphantria cunea granulovirus]
MSFFRGLRRTNRVYNSPLEFTNDFTTLINPHTPNGFLLNAPTTRPIAGNAQVPGFMINNNFVPNAQINRLLRNNDVTGMRNLFNNLSNNQISGLSALRSADNIPDATLHSLQMRKESVRRAHPETAVRDAQGVDNALRQNPRLRSYLYGAGAITLVGVGAYLVINVADLIESIVAAINRTGGSWYHRGNNGGNSFENIESCVLRWRSCGMPLQDIQEQLCVLDPLDPNNVDPILNLQQAQNLCAGYNREKEGTVCRASDTNAPPDSLRFLDISSLEANQTIECIEPYDLADLIADLGLDGLLGDNGLLTQSSNSSLSVSNNFFTIILVIGGVLLLVFIGFIVFRMTAK